jgi:beta-glucosidase
LHRDDRTAAELVAEALKIANQSDVIVAALGESQK